MGSIQDSSIQAAWTERYFTRVRKLEEAISVGVSGVGARV